MAEQNTTVEKVEDLGQGEAGKVNRWLHEIKAYDTVFGPWVKRSRAIVQRYRDEKEDGEANPQTAKFNILWSNIQIMGPALYAREPVPDVSRRYKDRDPVGRVAATVLERCLSYSIDSYDFGSTVKAARDDYLLTARGQTWVRYLPHYGEETRDQVHLQETDGVYRDDEGTEYPADRVDTSGEQPFALGEPYRPVVYEEALCDHIAWADFGHTPAPKWDKVTAVWKRELLTREQLVERFGKEKGEKVSLQTKAHAGLEEDRARAFGDVFMRATVYEIWHKPTRKVIWISPGFTEGPLDEKDDPLHLNGFFPCPKPLFGTMTTDTLVPVPDYAEYQTQATQIDTLTQRIDLLIDAIRVVGVYNNELTQLDTLLQGQSNKMVPVDNWAMFAEKGGLQGQVDWFPVEQVAKVLQVLSEARDKMKQDLYEVTGISDIVRGQVDPREKLGQSQLKGQFASIRIQDRQNEMARFIRDTLRLKGEIIAEHFSEDTLMMMSGWLGTEEAKVLDRRADKARKQVAMLQQQMAQAQQTGQPLPPVDVPEIPPTAEEAFMQAVELLREDRLRTFRLDIEPDSIAFEDQQAEKQSRTELVTALGGFLNQSAQIAQSEPKLKPVLGHILLFAMRGYKIGRQVESLLEEALEDMENADPQEMQQQDPAAAAQAQADALKAQVEQAKLKLQEMELQAQSAKDAAAQQFEQTKFQHESAMEAARLRGEEADKAHARMAEEVRLQIERTLAEAKLEETRGKQALEGAKLADNERQRQFEAGENQADRNLQADMHEESMEASREAAAAKKEGRDE